MFFAEMTAGIPGVYFYTVPDTDRQAEGSQQDFDAHMLR